jgi:hypothetical protein
MLSLPPVMKQSCLLMLVHSPCSVYSNIFSHNLFSCFWRTFFVHIVYKRMPRIFNTFNHSHEFIQLSLALNPTVFTNSWQGCQMVYLHSKNSILKRPSSTMKFLFTVRNVESKHCSPFTLSPLFALASSK